ncbi:hypothetical protein BU25DRAFT_461345 [Macroventuria anomochaeta]|uniref:Uncharacterized protein n=1 Tax=Macroventuria anomochaeta TaxID=301207 RepID=A0ACB6RQA7_9PLEO|nr:uncharacterized protein BU25DRAFT_461345 [Macroventuria anomochaeta]KAF2624155.1 hypothetical protein BU25DRAFT_461345 [Macroventuria anomochaeta]
MSSTSNNDPSEPEYVSKLARISKEQCQQVLTVGHGGDYKETLEINAVKDKEIEALKKKRRGLEGRIRSAVDVLRK